MRCCRPIVGGFGHGSLNTKREIVESIHCYPVSVFKMGRWRHRVMAACRYVARPGDKMTSGATSPASFVS